MVEEIAFETGSISNLQGLVTSTLDRVILHTVVHRSSSSTYMPNFIEIEETFCGWTDGRTFETHFIRSTQKSRPNKSLNRNRLRGSALIHLIFSLPNVSMFLFAVPFLTWRN